jgi:hypothetical protein
MVLRPATFIQLVLRRARRVRSKLGREIREYLPRAPALIHATSAMLKRLAACRPSPAIRGREPGCSFLLAHLPSHSGGNAGHGGVIGHVAGHHGPRANQRPFADCDAR